MTDIRRLDEVLRAEDGGAGCAAGEEILDAYVESKLAGEDPTPRLPRQDDPPSELPQLPGRSRGLLDAAPPVRRREARVTIRICQSQGGKTR